jgi:choline kinase
MTIVITMAGAGSRFRVNGYTVPKYMITARGRTLFEWSLLSLTEFFNERFVLACREDDDPVALRSLCTGLGICNVVIQPRSSLSAGQAETVLDVLDIVDSKAALWIYNIDTYVQAGLRPVELAGISGVVPVFESESPGMSYVLRDADGRVTTVAEKRRVSQWATVGLYGFSSAEAFSAAYEMTYGEGRINEQAEEYVAPMYNALIESGGLVIAPILPNDAVHILGTPDEVQLFDPRATPPSGSTV